MGMFIFQQIYVQKYKSPHPNKSSNHTNLDRFIGVRLLYIDYIYSLNKSSHEKF